jgi:hypothetical protein
MFLLRESLWWVLVSGAIGYFCGWGKGRSGLGLILGLLFGPFGCLAIMLVPAAPRRRPAARGPYRPGPAGVSSAEEPSGDADPALGSACPRCRRSVSRGARACPHCGNVLIPIRYAVE